jgi:hypothetical protein
LTSLSSITLNASIVFATFELDTLPTFHHRQRLVFFAGWRAKEAMLTKRRLLAPIWKVIDDRDINPTTHKRTGTGRTTIC